jgi:hypothetical protein
VTSELYIHIRYFEEKLKQVSDYNNESKIIVFATQTNIKHFNPLTSRPSNENFIQHLNHETSKDVMLLSKIFHEILLFERKYNKEREERDKKAVCFACHKKDHRIHSCFMLFSHLKNDDGSNH